MLKLPDLDEVERARARIAGYAIRTPLVRLGGNDLSREIYLKLECLQPYGSFKIRAATNALLSLPASEFKKGVVTGSAGNFGQGLAAAARAVGVPITVYAPETAAEKKIRALEGLGATVRKLSFADWWKVLETRTAPGMEGHFIHPVAESAVVAGNATIALEILEDIDEIGAVFVPFGGGGLISGVGAMIKALSPETKVIGCETEAATPLAGALAAREPVEVAFDSSTFVDGIGSTRVLDEMWPLVSAVTDDALSVATRDAEDAVRRLIRVNSVVAEGAGATPVAAALQYASDADPIVCVVSGGNLDAAVLGRLMAEQ